MKIVILTRSWRVTPGVVAAYLAERGFTVEAALVEDRMKMIREGKKGGRIPALLKKYGAGCLVGKAGEYAGIKAHYLIRRIWREWPDRRFYSIEEAALVLPIALIPVPGHNSEKTVEILKKLRPDVVLTLNARIIGPPVLAAAPLFLNLHTSLLPRYAGMASIFWALVHGEKEIGVTVHRVTEGLDAGGIFGRERIPVGPDDTEGTLSEKALDTGKRLLGNVLQAIADGTIQERPMDGPPEYFKWPTREERKAKHHGKSTGEKPAILHIITRMCQGGAQENTYLTVRHFRKAGYRADLVYGSLSAGEQLLDRPFDEDGYHVLPSLVREVNLLKDVRTFFALFGIIRNGRYDIVHTHTSKAGMLGRVAARMAGVPVIVHTPHGNIFYGYFSRPVTFLFIVVERFLALFSDAIIMLTDKCRDEHLKAGIGGERLFRTICSGVEEERFSSPGSRRNADYRKRYGIPETAVLVGCAARLTPIKGIRYLIEAMTGTGPDVCLLLAGDGEERVGLERLRDRLKLSPRVFFLGMTARMDEFYDNIDIFALSSLNEGMGRVLVEAGLMARPVVATAVSGIPEMVKEGTTGFLVPPKDGQAMAEKIEYLARNPSLRKEMGENGRAFMKGAFTAGVMCREIERLYEEIGRRKGCSWMQQNRNSGAGKKY